MRWYLTISTVLEYQRLCGRPVERDGPEFDRAERELADLCNQARRVDEQRPEPHRELYRVTTRLPGRSRSVRLELTVTTQQRTEGDLPQLVRVRDKGAASRGR